MVRGIPVLLLLAGLGVPVHALRKSRSGRGSVEEGESVGTYAIASSCSEANTTDALIQCAEDTVGMYSEQITNNLLSHGISKLDLGWPGTGFNQAAYGGQWQVFTALERRSSFRVENIVGASGGASSSVLALADVDRSARTMLDTLMSPAWGSITTSGEYTTYKDLMQTGNFDAVRNHAYSSVVCRSNWNVMYIVHNFTGEDQAAKAFAASGDVLSVIFGNGYSMGSNVRRCADGGDLMGVGSNPMLYYNTAYGYTTGCDRACVLDLYKKGVEATITTLLSANLQAGSGGGAMAIQKPNGGNWTLQQYRDWVGSGGFWEILTTSGGNTERIFVKGQDC